MCERHEYYVFSNVNNGIPKRSCIKAISDIVVKIEEPVLISAAISTTIITTALVSMFVVYRKYPEGPTDRESY